ncbi:MAG: lytic transglycosylase domain-containing protein [Bacteroidales bacterium]|nr:lytic transglycosylase domain-containing protein [Bacteroidales bacterium]
MKITKKIKLPALLIVGIGIGFVVSSLFIFSNDIQNEPLIDNNNDSVIIPYNVFQPHIPKKLDFCGENVPLQYFDVREALDYELIINTYRHSSTILYIKRANRYFPEIERILKENGIPDDMKYLCVAESGLANVVSPANATGFWQFMRSTAIEKGMEVNRFVDERYHPQISAIAATVYLKEAYQKFGNWTLAAASYNMGMSGLKKNIDHQRSSNYWDLALNSETARYVYRILAYKLILSNPEKYGFNILEKDRYQMLNTVEIKIDSTITDLVQFAYDNGTNYKMLKYFNPWLRGNSLINNTKKEYTILIPEKGVRDCEIPIIND